MGRNGKTQKEKKHQQQKQTLLTPLQLSERLIALEQQVIEMRNDLDRFKTSMIDTFKLTNSNVATNMSKITKIQFDFEKFEQDHPDLFKSVIPIDLTEYSVSEDE